MRHGKAEEARFEGLDGDRARRLTAEDEQRLRETLPGLRGLQVRPHRILSSPYPRAYPTACLVARALLNSPEPEVCPRPPFPLVASSVAGALEIVAGFKRRSTACPSVRSDST